MKMEGLASPEFVGQWWLLGVALVSIAFNYFLGEEFLFRGVLLPKMKGVFGKYDWVALAVLFGLYHLHKPWSLPSIIVEHENYWSQAAFFQDFWKLLAGYAPLRVMIGYAGSPTGIDALTRAVMQHAVSSRWRYPPQTEDLVLLRSPTMAWPTWRVLRRDAESNSWKDSGTLLSDAVTV